MDEDHDEAAREWADYRRREDIRLVEAFEARKTREAIQENLDRIAGNDLLGDEDDVSSDVPTARTS